MTEKFANEKEFLANYNVHDFDVPLCTVDMAIFTVEEGALKVLLVKRANYPKKGKWALPGGFIDLANDKDLAATAHRKLTEKTGVTSPYLEQVSTVGNKSRDPRGWSITVSYFALISAEGIALETHESTEEVAWLPVDSVLEDYKLAFDHKDILSSCLQRLKSKVLYTSLPIHLLPDTFTLPELQSVYEIILGQSLQKKSFRKRILDAEIIEETGEMKATGASRPAQLYKACEDHLAHVFPRTLEGVRTD